MAITKKTWKEKLNCGKSYQIKVIDKDFADIKAGSTMLIASPQIIDEYIKKIPIGICKSLKDLREDLAKNIKQKNLPCNHRYIHKNSFRSLIRRI
ncbi:MAG: hypothetical protein QNJ31_09610 [Candidatus Caenarcaniphilales bacterium]|nr:hypothetical protein [Candidatus Caenarcaniphilales bacterium]